MKAKTNLPLVGTVLLASSLLFSCSNSKKSSLIIPHKLEAISSFVSIEEDYLKRLLDSEQDLILYVGDDSCSSCVSSRRYMDQYIKDTENIIYHIESDLYQNVQKISSNNELIYNLPTLKTTPTLILIKEGDVVYSKSYSDDATLFTSASKLSSTLAKYISNNGIYLANDFTKEEANAGSYRTCYYYFDFSKYDNVMELIGNNDKKTILFSRMTCGDCVNLNKNFLDSFLVKNDKKLYKFECFQLKLNDDNGNVLSKFYEDVQINDYLGGRVPTFATYNNGERSDIAVFVNDVIELNSDKKYEITNSFYESMIGLTADSYEDLYNKAMAKEIEFIKEYLAKNL